MIRPCFDFPTDKFRVISDFSQGKIFWLELRSSIKQNYEICSSNNYINNIGLFDDATTLF